MEHVDGLRPARLTIGIISAGRVGTALGVALERADHVVVACSAISAGVAPARPTLRLPDTAVLPPDEVAGRAELLLLAVPDAELAGWCRPRGHLGGAAGHHRRPHVGCQRHRRAGTADRAGLHPAGHPSRDDVHRLG